MLHSLTPRQELRQQLLNRRRNVMQNVRCAAAEKIAATVCILDLFRHSSSIACYLACKGEVDVLPIMQQIWAQKKKCYLPLLDPLNKRNLIFELYLEHDVLRIGRNGISEPIYEKDKTIAPECLDLVIVPLVGFDENGNRLGQGGGCYDYTFAFKNKAAVSKPYLLGVAYEWQKVPFLESSDWDVKLDMIVTEESIYSSR